MSDYTTASVDMSDHTNGLQDNLDTVTHVRLRRAKPGVLGHAFEGPYEIVERLGESCIKLRVGSYANGTPRFEVHHWDNAKPAVYSPTIVTADKPRLGRKRNATVLDNTVDESPPVVPPPIRTSRGRISKPPDRFEP